MKKNILANLAGRFWGVFSNFLFIPLYIEYLGFDSYSLISFTLILAGMIAIVDAGLTSTLQREFAREDKNERQKVKVFNTLESSYFAVIGACIGISYLLTPLFIDFWLSVDSTKFEHTSLYVNLAIIEILFQLLIRFYKGGLLGLEKQVTANVFQIAWGAVRNGLVIFPLLFFPNLGVFFAWQLISSIIFALILKYLLSREFGGKIKFYSFPKIEIPVLKDVWEFAGGVLLISLVASINTQLDRFTISKLLNLEVLGYYTLAMTAAKVSNMVISPISIAVLPRLTALYSKGEVKKGSLLYNKINVVVVITIFTVMLLLIFYSKEVIWIWTGDLEIANNSSLLVSILTVGYSMLTLQVLPYKVALANGYTKLNNIIGLISLLATIPGYIYFTDKFGASGAAATFTIVQGIITIFYVFLIGKKFIQIERPFKYYIFNYFLPFILVFMIVYLASYINIVQYGRILGLIWIGTVFCSSILVTSLILVPKTVKTELKSTQKFIKSYLAKRYS